MYSLTKKVIAESIGTFVLVFFACGTAMTTNNILATALAFGLVIIAMAYSIGKISGCHINPAVSLAMLICKKMTLPEFFAYVGAQLVGAICGALAITMVCNGAHVYVYNDATNVISGSGAWGICSSLLVEIILTFVFVYTILGVISKKEESNISGLIIGASLTLVHLLGIRITGTSVNPARSIGPAIATLINNNNVTALKEVWLFIVAPLVGATIAAFVFMALHKETPITDSMVPTDDQIKAENTTNKD